jgi:hypothetical protein
MQSYAKHLQNHQAMLCKIMQMVMQIYANLCKFMQIYAMQKYARFKKRGEKYLIYALCRPTSIEVLVMTMQQRQARGSTVAYDQQAVKTTEEISSPKCTTCQDWQWCG